MTGNRLIFIRLDHRAWNHRVNKISKRESSEGTSQPEFLTRDKSLLEPLTAKGMDSLWWTLGSELVNSWIKK